MDHSFQSLPTGYTLRREIDLQKDKKTAVIVNVLSGVIMLAMGFIMNAFIPISSLFDMSEGFSQNIVRLVVFLLGIFVYVVLHELTHAAVMKRFKAQKVKFGFTGLYAFAGSPETFFDRYSYIRISLAPFVLWGIIFGIMCVLSGTVWFWVFWAFEIMNVAGAAGDIYVTCVCCRMSNTILINDDGVSMRIYDKE